MPSPYRRPSLSIDPSLTKDIRGYSGKRLPTPGLQTSNSTLSAYDTVKLGELATRKAGSSHNSFSVSEKPKSNHAEMIVCDSPVTENFEVITPATPKQAEFSARETEYDAVPSSPKTLPSNALPSERPKQRRRRTKLHEYMILEAAFCKDPLPDAPTRERLARELVMSPRAVQVWFQNRRQALKRKNEIEMLHAGISTDARRGKRSACRSGNDDTPQHNENHPGRDHNDFADEEPGCSCREKQSANGVQQCLACLNLVSAVNKAFEGQAKPTFPRREPKRLNSDPERRGLRSLVPIAPKCQSIGERRASRLGIRSEDLMASLTLASVAAQSRYPASASIAASIISPLHTHGIYNSPSSPGLPSLPLSPFVMTPFHPPAPCCSPDVEMFPISSHADDHRQNSPKDNMLCMHLPPTPGLSSAFEATHIGDHKPECQDSAALPTPNLTPAASPPKSDTTTYYPRNGHCRLAHRLPTRIDANLNGFVPSVRSPLAWWASADLAGKTSRDGLPQETVKDSALDALCETAAKQEYLPVPLPPLEIFPKLSGSPSNDMEIDEADSTSSPTSAESDGEIQVPISAVGKLWRPWD